MNGLSLLTSRVSIYYSGEDEVLDPAFEIHDGPSDWRREPLVMFRGYQMPAIIGLRGVRLRREERRGGILLKSRIRPDGAVI